MRKLSLAAAALVIAAGAAHADSIDGAWITARGDTAVISGGTITDPQDDKTYSGTAKLAGSSLELTGCAMSVFCRTQTWKKK